MQATPDAQRKLLDLQRVDTGIAQLEHRRRTLPELAQITEAQKVRGRLGEQLIAARTRVSDLEIELEKAEADLVPVRQRRERDQQRVDNGSVTDPKQLNALLDEIQHLGRRINDLEDVELEVMERLEEATSERDRITADRAGAEPALRALIAARDEQTAALDVELEGQRADRSTIVGVLPTELVALYDKLRGRLGGIGAAALIRRRCSGCQLEATATDLDRYSAAAPDEVLRCEECDRILIRVAESGL